MNDSVQPQREKVVPLNAGRRQSRGPSLARLPAPMHSLRDKARQVLQGLLRELFDKADDALFELADQASSNQEQNLYFDSMREVRLQRRSVEQAFFRHLDQSFADLLDPGARGTAEAGPEPDVSLDELSLVQNDELEQLVATESMVNKANDRFAEPLQHLTMRMDQLVPVKVYQKNNPVGADVICTGFSESADALVIDVKAKLVLFKLFDKWVVSELGKLYDALNQQLIDAKILPSLKAGTPAQRSGGGSADARHRPARQERGHRDQEASEVLHTLRDLMGRHESGDGAAGNAGRPGEGSAELETHDLVTLLSRAQRHGGPVSDAESDPGEVARWLRELAREQRQRNLNQVDDDVINLVSMMFEFILDDRNLAPPMKALLGRLQIPLIKVAIADKRFFSKGGHPARRLLNELATAALGWQDGGEASRRKDSLYQKIDQVVQTILSEFESDIGIFDQMLLEFRAFQEKERRRARILEQRTLDAEDGKARSERARAEVDSVLERVARGQILEPAAHALLHEAWSKVLFIICLKQGTDSDDWREAVSTAEELVWTATAPMNRENRQRLLKRVPELLPRLRAGLESITYNPYDMTQLFKQLEQLHLARLRGGRPSSSKAGGRPAPAARGPESGPVEASAPPREPAAASGADPASAPAFQPVDESAAQAMDENADPAMDESADEGEVDERAPSATQTPAQETPLPASDPHMALVGNLTQGSWFEVRDKGGDPFRCRLAAMIKPTGKYIFVNRSGVKVAEETRETLARALKSGQMRILDDGMLFDRALEAVIGNLRGSRAR